MKNLLKELREHNIHVAVFEGNLKLKFDGDKPSSTLISKIKEHKEALISYLQEQENTKKSREVISKIASSTEGYDLSPAQNRLWVLSQLEGGLPAYNIPFQVELNAEYDIERFKKSVLAVIERHEILRTVFKENSKGDVKQFVLPFETFNFNIEYVDFRNEEDSKKVVTEYTKQSVSRVFSLSEGPLLFASLLQVSDTSYVFHYVMHHIISDGWSMGVLVKDAMAFYHGFESGNENSIAPLTIQYKDYAAWQLAKINNKENGGDQQFWEAELSGSLPLLNLPSILHRPAIKTNTGEILETYFSEELSKKLNDFTQENNSSLFVSLLSMWYILMYRYTGEKDIIIGSPVAGREHLDLETQIGFYVNTLALRTNVNPEQTVRAYYNEVKEHVFSALSHQTYPFDHLVKGLNLSRDTSRSMVFDVMLAFQNTGEKISDQFVKSIPEFIQSKGNSLTKFDIEINFSEVGRYISFVLNYNTDVYEKEMMEQVMRHFMQLVNVCMDTPDVAIKDLEFLTKEEQESQVVAYDNSNASYPKDITIVDLFNEQVQQHPNNIAIVYEGTSFTYKEVDNMANQFANYLQSEYKVQEEDLIGIQLDRSEWMIIAILGVLKVGGAYVPIDVDYPKERIDYILEDIDSKVVIDESIVGVFLDKKDIFSTEQPSIALTSSNLAYIIYTSGTTGKSKGTLIQHNNVVRLLYNNKVAFDFNENDVWCLFHSYCFDFSVWEIFGALLFGGKLVIVPKTVTRDSNAFAVLLKQEGVTVLNQTPTAFEMLKDIVIKDQLEVAVRYVIFGGEALNTASLKEWKATFPTCKLINMYGITETTVHVTYKEITEKEIALSQSNIGKPIPTLGILLLDENQKIVPKGVAGELCVYGDGLARGYLNKNEITKRQFINFENNLVSERRLYRSGDYAKSLSNNELVYIGRIDKQVKIRGHRIELGEIEHALLNIEEVKQCVVQPKITNTEKKLVAYLVAEDNVTINKVAIKKTLQENLPEYMVPSFYSILEGIPLTSNGKVDRKQLPEISSSDIIKSQYVQPKNEMEAAIIEEIKAELGEFVSEIGVTDNFFDLGLDSFSLLKVLNKINAKLGVDLKPLDLFQYPNVQSLTENALRIEQEEDESTVNIAEDMDSMVDIF